MEGMITIKKEVYDKLLERDLLLTALENAGVDNWSGYGEAHELLEQWEKENNLPFKTE